MDNDLRSRPVPASAVPLSLPFPFDDDVDRPIDLVLTGAAHRELDPARVPALRLVEPVVEAPDPSDTRPAQARALLRSGMPVTTIAAALGVSQVVVQQWTHDVEVSRRRRGRAVRSVPADATAVDATPADSDLAHRGRVRGARDGVMPAGANERDDRFLQGVALALVQIADRTVSIVHDRPELVELLVAELRRRTDVPVERFRVSVRVAPPLATDRVRREVAALLGVDVDRVIAGRTSQPLTATGLEVRVDISDDRIEKVARAWLGQPETAVRRGA